MGKPYAIEMASLGHTVSWASMLPIEPLVRAIAPVHSWPLVTIGSGGSLATCEFMAMLHRRIAGKPARTATPLAYLQEGSPPGESPWLISAGGSNVDVLRAFDAAASAEPHTFGVLCAASLSPLVSAARHAPHCQLVALDLPTGQDGFLATNSLIAFALLLLRAYRAAATYGAEEYVATELMTSLAGGRDLESVCKGPLGEALARRTLIVLHGAATKAAAVDIESRFAETALGNVQLADYRNFAHGRHFWAARFPADTAVIGLATPDEIDLASRTMAALPDLPKVRVDLSESWGEAAIEGLLFSQRLAQFAGQSQGVDPGRPGVPEFGHQIYDMNYEAVPGNETLNRGAQRPISRKVGDSRLPRDAIGKWSSDLVSYQERLSTSLFGALVLDYDGTLVSAASRTRPPEEPVVSEMLRLLHAGVRLAIATGRGASVRKAMCAVIPEHLRTGLLVGYYNGADALYLSDATLPQAAEAPCQELSTVTEALAAHHQLSFLVSQVIRPYQITLEPRYPGDLSLIWSIANEVIAGLAIAGVRVVRSSHSVDVLAANASKRNVVELMRRIAAPDEVLCIGDCGRWPGNDFELLSVPYSLSVDQVSHASDRCWNLASPAVRGVEATLEYLRAIEVGVGGRFRFNVQAAKE